jgi:hypothetical protein
LRWGVVEEGAGMGTCDNDQGIRKAEGEGEREGAL